MFSAFIAVALPTLSSAGITATSSCYWHVSQQTLLVEKPWINEFPVELQCPHSRFGEMHEEICTTCETLDNQCAGAFVACTGCCELQKAARYHNCENIQKYFRVKNTLTLQCDARYELPETTPKVEDGPDTTARKDEGTIKLDCDVEDKRAVTEEDLVPVKLKFDCNNCATQGVPDLLKQCCDRAADFSNGVMVQELESQGAKVFLWADGCHDSFIGPDKDQKFGHKFPQLTEKQIDADMNEFVKNTYCSKSVDANMDKCPPGGGYGRRLKGNSLWQGNSSRQLNADPDCPWLSEPFDATSATSLTATPAAGLDQQLVDGADGLHRPLRVAFLGGGFAFLSLV